MFDLFDGGTIAASAAAGVQSQQVQSQQGFSGVLIRAAAYTTIPLTQLGITLRTEEDGVISVAANVPLLPLVERADLRGGVGYGPTFVQQTSTAGGTETEDIASICAFVDFGHALLGGDDSVTVTFSVISAYGAGDGLRWWFVDTARPNEGILKASVGGENTVFKDCEELLLFRLSGDATDRQADALTPGALNVTKKVNGDNGISIDALAYYALSRAIGEVEAEGPRRTFYVHGDLQGAKPGATVNILLTGTDKANWAVLGFERHRSLKRAQRSAARARADIQGVLSNLANSDPERFAAHRLSGAGILGKAA